MSPSWSRCPPRGAGTHVEASRSVCLSTENMIENSLRQSTLKHVLIHDGPDAQPSVCTDQRSPFQCRDRMIARRAGALSHFVYRRPTVETPDAPVEYRRSGTIFHSCRYACKVNALPLMKSRVGRWPRAPLRHPAPRCTRPARSISSRTSRVVGGDLVVERPQHLRNRPLLVNRGKRRQHERPNSLATLRWAAVDPARIEAIRACSSRRRKQIAKESLLIHRQPDRTQQSRTLHGGPRSSVSARRTTGPTGASRANSRSPASS